MKSFTAPTLLPEKRRHTRVIFTRTVRMSVNDSVVGEFPARNLSMGGLFIGDAALADVVEEECQLELREKGEHSSLILKFSAKVVRVEPAGIAVEFTDMEDDSFMFLQTMVLYASDDPIGIAKDFLEDFSLISNIEKTDSASG
ncbi:PilZ domain-containing protein [Desulfogranum marinum]|uniref:PilZ domain-containing protein n=1 Tax=Desulfogranum marinum TaxID=453220 RepID=UPI0019632F86|nr:PilZ domain-containing protein [Desulfogranum marinum]MBM9513897.1 PilZ domain-containing protein [Desulfogranum marinum]MEE4259848.1 PilZ domain-containing protein [Bacteroidales bacterium]